MARDPVDAHGIRAVTEHGFDGLGTDAFADEMGQTRAVPSAPRYYAPSRPRPVAGGLTARTTRGAIGSSWWSKRFIEVLESFAIGTRLTRGRAYARKGQVIDLSIAPGLVSARVQGSRAKPYRVQIGLTPFSAQTWTDIDAALAAQAIHTAALLAGEFPTELEEVFAAAGAQLFPSTVKELLMTCSCPDWGLPCKHLAASFYLLAERFDDDPFEILHWRGRPREQLLAHVREQRSAPSQAAPGPDAAPLNEDSPAPGEPSQSPSPDVPLSGTPSVAGAAVALTGVPEPSTSPALYWSAPVPMPAWTPPVDTPADLLLRQLPDPPEALGGEAFTRFLRAVYDALPDVDEPTLVTPSQPRPPRAR